MDPFLREVSHGVVRAWWAQLAASVGSSPVVVARVIGQHGPQVPRADDQHPVGYLHPDGEHEALREGVRARAARRDLRYFDAGCGQDRVERCGELPGPVADQEPESGGAVAEVWQEGSGPAGWSRVRPGSR